MNAREIVKTWNWAEGAAHNPQHLPDSAFKAGKPKEWALRHVEAMSAPYPDFETSVVTGLRAWLTYAEHHKRRYGSGIGEDYFLGDYWGAWGFALLGLLNGATGRLDCGTLSTILRETLEAEGWDTDMQERRK